MKKLLIILISVFTLMTVCACSDTPAVYLQTPRGEQIKVDGSKARELINCLNNLELIPFDDANSTYLYGSLEYRFTIMTNEGEAVLQASDYGIVLYKDTLYIQSAFESLFDISREIYEGINDVLYDDEQFTNFPVVLEKRHVNFVWEGKVYYPDVVFINGDCTLREIAGWYHDEMEKEITVKELFETNNKKALNSVVEVSGRYNYIFKKISQFENVYLLKCDGPYTDEKNK